jgi:photosystem I P700 chlorophyll a apoprotein A2
MNATCVFSKDGYQLAGCNKILNVTFQEKATSACMSTARIFHVMGHIHDQESSHAVMNSLDLAVRIFLIHWGHLAVLFSWLAGVFFHLAWQGNYDTWVTNPRGILPIANDILDPHMGKASLEASSGVAVSYSGLYNLSMSIGFVSGHQCYSAAIILLLVAAGCLILGKFHLEYWDLLILSVSASELVIDWEFLCSANGITHGRSFGYHHATSHRDSVSFRLNQYISRSLLGTQDMSGLRLNYHIGVLIGCTSLLWSGHLIHVAIPVSRGITTSVWSLFNVQPHPEGLAALFSMDWTVFSSGVTPMNEFGSSINSGESILTLHLGLNGLTDSLWLTDISHHQLAIGVILIWTAHLYSSVFKGFGQAGSDVLLAHGHEEQLLLAVNKSLNLQLALALSGLGVITSLVAQHMYSLNPMVYLTSDYVTYVSLYVHHQYIASFMMVGSFAHAGIFLARDSYSMDLLQQPTAISNTKLRNHSQHGPRDIAQHNWEDNTSVGTRWHLSEAGLIAFLIQHKAAIIAQLSWVCLFLGFHVLGIFMHNDVVTAFGEVEKQILIEPVFAQIIQSASGKDSYGMALLLPTIPTSLDEVLLPLGPTDLMAHHSIALGLHVTVLILLKGALDARGSTLMPDKLHFGYGFACDGPGRGGTCDISAWDSFYLAMFWMLNTVAWLTFYFHWKLLALGQSALLYFDTSGVYLMGWFRDYLWFNSSQIINGYSAYGANDLAVWDWIFLLAHLSWALGFMFLISWRGYWQELIDSILFMHLQAPVLRDIWQGQYYTPVALSIVQARFIGLVHFSVGFILTYAAFVIASCS